MGTLGSSTYENSVGHGTRDGRRSYCWYAALLGLGLLFATGCQFDRSVGQSGEDAGGWYLADTGTDSDEPPPTPQETAFTIVNTTNHPIRIQQRSPCGSVQNQWVSVRAGGSKLDVDTSCRQCRCRSLREGGGCSVCAVACEAPGVERLAPGESTTWNWHGYYMKNDTVEGQSCHRKKIPAPKRLGARFCWSDEAAPVEPGTRLKNTKCETISFRYGSDAKVRYEVDTEDEAPKPTKTTFELRNESNRTVTIAPTNRCSRPRISWMQLEQGGESVRMSSDCRDCRCKTLDSGESCDVCHVDCAAPQPRALAPGETVETTWSGYAFRREKVGGDSCLRKRVPNPAETFTAEFCWREADLTPDERPGARECERVQFEYGRDGNVTATIEAKEKREAVERTFRLVNETSAPIRVQRSHYCEQSAWIDFPNMAVKDASTPCGPCTCEVAREQDGCPPCAAGACLPPRAKTLQAGDSVEWKWSGYAYRSDSYENQTCLRRSVPSIGSRVEVRFCWKPGAGESGTNVELRDQTCVTRRVVYGGTSPVVERVE